jgi:hypothetical protein
MPLDWNHSVYPLEANACGLPVETVAEGGGEKQSLMGLMLVAESDESKWPLLLNAFVMIKTPHTS